jgi:hypothetical protein
MKNSCGCARRGGRAELGQRMPSPRVGNPSVDEPANQNDARVWTRRGHRSSLSHRGGLHP